MSLIISRVIFQNPPKHTQSPTKQSRQENVKKRRKKQRTHAVVFLHNKQYSSSSIKLPRRTDRLRSHLLRTVDPRRRLRLRRRRPPPPLRAPALSVGEPLDRP